MSWITPVPAYQYMDYQNRVIGWEKNRYTIERTNPVVLDKRQETFEQRVQDRLDYQAVMLHQKPNEADEVTPFDSQTYSLLTGKGRHIDTQC